MLALWLAALLGCSKGLPSALDDCPDLACRQRWVVETWARDPDAVYGAIEALPDPVERIALVRQLSVTHPGEATRLCALLPGHEEQQACRNRNQRPHLREVAVSDAGVARSEREDDDHGLQLTRPIASPWAEVAAQTLPCASEARACQTLGAKTAAQEGRFEAAAAACNALPEAEWVAECFFQAAEAGATVRGATGGRAVGLCLGAASFAGRCLSHLVRQYGTTAPRAASNDHARWSALTETVAAAWSELDPHDPELAHKFEGQAWAYALRFAAMQEDAPSGAPLDHVPAAAAPHARAAAAWALWRAEGAERRELAAWEARLDAVLADRAPRAPGSRPPPPTGQDRRRSLWRRTMPGEETIRRVPFLGPDERALAEDPRADALIALLEAAARGRPPAIDLLAEALGHEDRLVRWTAARLLGALEPRHPALQRPEETDPLVRGRLQRD